LDQPARQQKTGQDRRTLPPLRVLAWQTLGKTPESATRDLGCAVILAKIV
jgi:hypothetical protein